MNSIPSNISSKTLHEVFPSVNAQMTGKLNELQEKTLKRVEQNRDALKNQLPYNLAHEIGVEVLKQITDWAHQTFTTSPEKEVAQFWLISKSNHIQGAHGFPKQVLNILLNNNA